MNIERMNKGQWGKVKAFFDLKTDEGFVIKGFKLVEGINGLFVGFPSQKGEGGEYFNTVFAERELRDELVQLALKEYGGDAMTPSNPESVSSANNEILEKVPVASTTADAYDDDIPF